MGKGIAAKLTAKLLSMMHSLTHKHEPCRFVPLPKSATPERILSNTRLYDFSLDPDDMAQLDGLDKGKEGSISWNPVDSS